VRKGVGLQIYYVYICNMMYLVTINGVVQLNADTTLFNSCMRYDIPYWKAYRGKREFDIKGNTVILMEITLNKVKGRGRKF
jgi:hypothetical protein